MNKVIFGGAIITAACLLALPAHAQWIHQEEEDAFSGSVQHVALTAAGGYGLGLRCSDEEELALVFMTPENADEDAIDGVNLVGAEILVRVDSNEVIKLTSDAVLLASGKLALLSRDTEVATAADQAVAAKQRIAIAIEAAGERFHTQTFSVRGSTNAINKAIMGCGLE